MWSRLVLLRSLRLSGALNVMVTLEVVLLADTLMLEIVRGILENILRLSTQYLSCEFVENVVESLRNLVLL